MPLTYHSLTHSLTHHSTLLVPLITRILRGYASHSVHILAVVTTAYHSAFDIYNLLVYTTYTTFKVVFDGIADGESDPRKRALLRAKEATRKQGQSGSPGSQAGSPGSPGSQAVRQSGSQAVR